MGIYSKKEIQIDATIFADRNISDINLEIQWVVISKLNTKNILLANVYRPPNGNIKEALNKIEELLTGIPRKEKYEILIIGDFNMDFTTSKPTHNMIKYFELTNEIKQVITTPTRITRYNKTIIDLAFTNMKYCTETGTLNYNISDHKPIYVIKKKPRNIKKTTVYRGRTYRNYSYQKLEEILKSIDNTEITEAKDPNICWELLLKNITTAADMLCPIIELHIRENTAQYLNNELLELQHDRDYFAKKAELTGDPCDWFIAKSLAIRARIEVRKAKSAHCKRQAEMLKQEQRKLWREIKQIDPEYKPEIQDLYDENTGIKIQDTEMAEKINDYFVSIGEKLASKFNNDQPTHVDDTEVKINKDKYDLKPTSIEEVTYRINDLPRNKPSGINNISTELMKGSMQILIEEFTYLYNLIIKIGVFPDDWKKATVTPIPKVNNPKTCNELRPISILPLPGKVMEQIIHDQIKIFLEGSKYLGESQFGFRQGKSTTKALARVMDSLLNNMDKGDLTVAVFLDFRKAFDTINHKLLLDKAKKAGLGKNTTKLIENYLSNRNQRTKINNKESPYREVKTGVPQGSTLGPLLFLLFINDLPETAKTVMFTLFADDAVFTLHGKEIKDIAPEMQKVLNKISTWCNANKLTINAKKTEYVIYGTKKKLAKATQIELKIGKDLLKEVKAYTYLGTKLDSTLNANAQLSKLNQNLAIKMNTMRRIRYFISEKTAIMLYKALILPIFDYNDIIYCLLTKQQQAKLQRTQNRALRTIFRGKNLSTKEMHKQASIDDLETRRMKHLLALMYDRAQEEEHIDNTIRITRQGTAALLTVPHPRTRKMEISPKYNGSTLWNELPSGIRNTNTRQHFKHAYNALLTSQSEETVK